MSWLKFIFSPKRSYREFKEVRCYSDEMTAYAESLELQLKELQTRCESLQAEKDDLQAGKTQVDEMANQLLSQLAECRQERDEYFQKFKETEQYVAQVDEIVKMVDKFGELKQNYELRISRLKKKLADAQLCISQLRDANGMHVSDDDILPIDFSRKNEIKETQYFEQQPKQQQKSVQAESVGLSVVKTAEVSQPSLFVDEEMPANSVVDDAGDWLRRLPEDLD